LINIHTECDAIGAACRLFDGMLERGSFSCSSVIIGLARSGQIDHARQLFDQMPESNVLSCATMNDTYVKTSHSKEALEIFQAVQTGDHKCFYWKCSH
jgi:pentatricopeptide repeat protein